MTEVDEFIAHFGKKGMKWGVRRKGAGAHGGKSISSKPKAKDLSDDQLRSAIGRMELEKRYNELSGATKTPNKVVGKFLGSVGHTVAKTAATALATQQVNRVLTKATSKSA